jgi:hypothetical protein
MPPLAAAAAFTVVGLTAFVVNFIAGVDGRCSESGWSGCGWIWQLSGWIVLVCVAGLIATGVAALVRSRRR